jgi:tRNA threonylcarbamoyladenosine biosynthesis protein TsaB
MAKKGNILAFDTALGGMSVGAQNESGKVFSSFIPTEREQAALLVPAIADCLQEAGVDKQALKKIGCTIGPGSFTGLRIGLTTAKVMGRALNIPVTGISTLDWVAKHYLSKSKDYGVSGALLIVLETKRQDFYAGFYDENGVTASSPFAGTAADILEAAPFENFQVGGNCLARFKEESAKSDLPFLEAVTAPDPGLLCEMTAQSPVLAEEEVKPLYLRGADVSRPRTPPRRLEQA